MACVDWPLLIPSIFAADAIVSETFVPMLSVTTLITAALQISSPNKIAVVIVANGESLNLPIKLQSEMKSGVTYHLVLNYALATRNLETTLTSQGQIPGPQAKVMRVLPITMGQARRRPTKRIVTSWKRCCSILKSTNRDPYGNVGAIPVGSRGLRKFSATVPIEA